MSNTDWDTKLVIGQKAKAPKVARNTSDLNGTHATPIYLALLQVSANSLTNYLSCSCMYLRCTPRSKHLADVDVIRDFAICALACL